MNDVRKKYEALRDENERLARLAEREMLNPALSSDEKQDAMERAKFYWQLSRLSADTVAHAADAHPKQFRGRRKLTEETDSARFECLRRIHEQTGMNRRQDLAHAAWKNAEAKSLFPSEDRIYKALTPEMFDRIRKRSG